MLHDRWGSLVYGGESFRANLCNAANGSRDRPIKNIESLYHKNKSTS